MSKIIRIIIVTALLLSISLTSSAFEKEDAELLLRYASAVVLYGGPSYTLVQIYELSPVVEGIPSIEAQKEKYPDAAIYVQSDTGALGECTYLSSNEYRAILRLFFSEDIAESLYNKSMHYKARSSDNGLKLREINGLLYDFGRYGDPYGAYFIESDFSMIDGGRATLALKYRSDCDTNFESEYEYETFDYTFMLKKDTDEVWRFTNFTSIYDNIQLSMHPALSELYNPKTSDSAVYITAAAGLIALCCAVICKKKIKT